MTYDPTDAAHLFITDEAAASDVIASARRAGETSATPQWIHHHPHGHLCDHRCGPLEATR